MFSPIFRFSRADAADAYAISPLLLKRADMPPLALPPRCCQALLMRRWRLLLQRYAMRWR